MMCSSQKLWGTNVREGESYSYFCKIVTCGDCYRQKSVFELVSSTFWKESNLKMNDVNLYEGLNCCFKKSLKKVGIKAKALERCMLVFSY